MTTERVPETEAAQAVRAGTSDARWVRLVADAARRAQVVEETAAEHVRSGKSFRSSLAEVAPGVGWSAYLHWRRRYQSRPGPPWERLLDERLPPPTPPIDDEVKHAACLLRRMDRSVNGERARSVLEAQFGARGRVSNASLKRVWRAAGLTYEAPPGSRGGFPEDVVELSGGGGLAFLAAADAELGASLALAVAVLTAGAVLADAQVLPMKAEAEEETGEPNATEDEAVGASERDERGRFLAGFNERWREGVAAGEADGRWRSDATKRERRVLATLATLHNEPETLAAKLLCMGASPLVSELRGFAGLESPCGAWLNALGGHPYMPATLDKALAELGLLDVGPPLWEDHATRWAKLSQGWCADGPLWQQWVVYIDTTQDPYWTRAFAKSGKVSRVGRVMPCLSRVAVSSGAGVALLIETVAGAAPLAKHMLPLLERLDEALGAGGEVSRLTVIDSEVGRAGLLWELHDGADRIFISVLKGAVLRGAQVDSHGDWQPYRERDELREVRVHLDGKGAPPGGIDLRGIEMRRPGTRHPEAMVFVTNAAPDEIPTAEVADAYLARWPRQEQLFRNARNGAGAERSHGHGGELVAHVALETQRERAERRLKARQSGVERAEADHALMKEAAASNRDAASRRAVALAVEKVNRAQRDIQSATAQLDRLRSMPTEIYARDTGRDSIMACLKTHAVMLLEYALREYFGAAPMEWRTFIQHFVPLPVTIRTTREICRYQIHANPRDPRRMALLDTAVAEVTRRKLRVDGRRLVIEVLATNPGGS